MLATNSIEAVTQWARDFFERALKEDKDVFVGLKDTVIPGYDGVMKAAVTRVYEEEFSTRFKNQGCLLYTSDAADE